MNKLKENTISNRTCGICRVNKDLNELNFCKDKSRPFGLSYNCKVCEKIRSRQKYIKNPRVGRYKLFTQEQKDKKYKIAKIYSKTKTGRAISLVSAYKKIDKLKGGKCDLTKEFLLYNIFNKECVYCGDTNNLGCDRIDNKKYHTVENILPCCKECNIARMDNFTTDEMKIIGLAIKQVKLNRIKELENLYT